MAPTPTLPASLGTYLKNLVALSRLSHQAHDPAARVRAREAVVASLRTDLLKTAQLGRLRALLKFSVTMSSLMEKGCRARLHFFRKYPTFPFRKEGNVEVTILHDLYALHRRRTDREAVALRGLCGMTVCV